MTSKDTSISGLTILTPKVFSDDRGYFTESFNKQTLATKGITNAWVQDNESRSSYGVIRGLHYQRAPYSQSKLVRVIAGKIYDVAVDLRAGSPTFGKWEGVLLSDEDHRQFLIPKGFAHGFSVLSPFAIVLYKCDAYYQPEADTGVRYDDPILNIDWHIPAKDIVVSEKDTHLPLFDPGHPYFPKA
jgi:dTDP-4-dehydrorhamnose 3,5-epimerase